MSILILRACAMRFQTKSSFVLDRDKTTSVVSISSHQPNEMIHSQHNVPDALCCVILM